MIAKCEDKDFKDIYEVINDGAAAYKGIIPSDDWQVPYMPEEKLKNQIDQGIQFWAYSEDGKIIGVMGMQIKEDVTLIRHAYVRTVNRNKGIGGKLLEHLRGLSSTPILIGTWAAANWAIEFYQKHGFRLLPREDIDNLLRKYWTITDRQIETSVVLADSGWEGEN